MFVCVILILINYSNIANFITLCWILLAGFKLTTLVVIGTDCIGSCKSNYNTITITTALKFGWCKQMCDLNHVVEWFKPNCEDQFKPYYILHSLLVFFHFHGLICDLLIIDLSLLWYDLSWVVLLFKLSCIHYWDLLCCNLIHVKIICHCLYLYATI